MKEIFIQLVKIITVSLNSNSIKLQEIFIRHRAGAFDGDEYNLIKSLIFCCEENKAANSKMIGDNSRNDISSASEKTKIR